MGITHVPIYLRPDLSQIPLTDMWIPLVMLLTMLLLAGWCQFWNWRYAKKPTTKR